MIGALSAVNEWATDLIEVVFVDLMRNDSVLQDPASYTVVSAPDDTGQAVTVKAVRSGQEISTTSCFLVISKPTLGACYDVTVVGALTTIDGTAMSTPTRLRFKAHFTKVDRVLSTRPAFYDLRPTAVYRNLLNAIFYQDHLIGGALVGCESHPVQP